MNKRNKTRTLPYQVRFHRLWKKGANETAARIIPANSKEKGNARHDV
jgi:hypothetical protein